MKLPGAETFLRMLLDKREVVNSIVKDMDTSQKNMEAFAKLEELYADGADISTEKVLKSAAKSLRHLNEVNMRILLILLVYVGGDNYSADAAGIAVKFGAGPEALREMIRSKMGGL